MKKIYFCASLALAALFLFFLTKRLARGYFWDSPITRISTVLADVQGDDEPELVAISRTLGLTPYGFHGKSLLVLEDESSWGFHRIISEFDIEEAKPLKVMAGDVNRDGSNEVSVMV
ncbi:MAG: hypothetical protein LBC41_18410, partial [Clostridiales bacterium]|nr:hypothetical protein [Clostridiales bacterium]